MRAQMFVVHSESKTGQTEKCGGCNWAVSRLYAYAETQEGANKLYESGEAGLCGDCMADLLVETGYKIDAVND